MMAERPPEVPSCMPESPPPEFTVICIDNGRRAVYCKAVYRAQVKAARVYCETVLQCDPKNIVSIITMSSLGFGVLLPPTSDLEQIMSSLLYVPCQGEGETEVQRALGRACSTFSSAPADMKKRLLMFVGSTIALHPSEAISYGKMLNESGVAVNVFNFFRLKTDSPYFNKEACVLKGHYRYGRAELVTLVTKANDNNNSWIVDVVDKYESSTPEILAESVLKDHDDYLKKKAAIEAEKDAEKDAEKNRSAAADEKDKSDKAQKFNEKNIGDASDGYGKRLSWKKDQSYKLKKKAAADNEKNNSVKAHELGRFNEKNINGKRFSSEKKESKRRKKTKRELEYGKHSPPCD